MVETSREELNTIRRRSEIVKDEKGFLIVCPMDGDKHVLPKSKYWSSSGNGSFSVKCPGCDVEYTHFAAFPGLTFLRRPGKSECIELSSVPTEEEHRKREAEHAESVRNYQRIEEERLRKQTV